MRANLYPTQDGRGMNEAQERLLSMYKDMKRVLDAHGIVFYVQYGTAIGALRHDGFIPWDDDIDVLVWEDDLPEVNRVLSEELDPAKYYYHVPTADTHPHVMFRGDDLERSLRERTTPFIDIFPIDRYPSTKLRQKLANVMIWGDVGSIWAIDHIKSLALHRAVCWIPCAFKKLAHWANDEGTGMSVVYSTGFGHCIFPAYYYGKPTMHVFEDSEVPLPEHIHEMLTHIFGDYMTPPPEDKRTGAGGFPCSVVKDYILEGRPRGIGEEAPREAAECRGLAPAVCRRQSTTPLQSLM